MMSTFLVIISLSGITKTVIGGKCPNVSSGSSCGVFKDCPYPNSDDWNCLKSTMNCNENNGQYYHCAKDVNGCYVQHCAKRVYCNSGEQPVLDLNEDTAMCLACPAEEYQRRRLWSNEQRECDYAKTKCDGEGEIECHPGTPTEDRTCRCDIHQKFALQGYAYNTRTCCSKDYDQECYCISFKDQCPPGTVRHYNYKCLPECSQGFYRQMDAEDCIAENSSSQTYVTSTGQTPHQDSQVPTGIIILLIVTIVLVSLFAVLILICVQVHVYCSKRRQKGGQNTGEPEVPKGDVSYSPEVMQLLPGQNKMPVNRRRSKNADIRQIIKIKADGALFNFGDNNNLQASQGTPESCDLRAGSFSTEEEDVSVNPEESRQEESIHSDETSMDTEPKMPVENEDIHPDETPVKYKPNPPREEADDQTKRKEVWNPPKGDPDDQTKRKEVSSPPKGDPDDQTKRKEVSSPPKGDPDDQTKRKKVWSPPKGVPDDQTKRKEVSSPPKGDPDDQTKRKKVWSPPKGVPDDQTKRKEVWSPPKEDPDDQTKIKEVWSPPKGDTDDQTKRKEVWSPPKGDTDDQTKRKEVWSPPKGVPDDQTK